MSNEENNVIYENHSEHKCLCQSQVFKNFLTIALGSFVGVYCALCLFSLIHKPNIIPGISGFDTMMRNQPPVIIKCPCKSRHFNNKEREKFSFEHIQRNEHRDPAPFDSERLDRD